jgi:hypothetical protein
MKPIPDLGSHVKPTPERYGILGAMIIGLLVGLPTGVCIGVIIAMLIK